MMKRTNARIFSLFLVLLTAAILSAGSGPEGAQAQSSPSPASKPAPSATNPANPGTSPPATSAQNTAPRIFRRILRAADGATLMTGNTPVSLWGVEAVRSASPLFSLRARTALDNALAGKEAECEIKGQNQNRVIAQCISAQDVDLGLFMLQQGYVTADRALVYGTVFEGPYLEAETMAQQKELGIWEPSAAQSSDGSQGTVMMSFGFILFLCILAAFTVLSVVIMRGFQSVSKAQNDNLAMMERERKLRDKERGIVAVMLESEIKSNKSKIEAFLVVYEEMLSALQDPDRQPRYKRAGDIVQKQPALDRSVFDRNTDKLDILGRRLASDTIHFYARIKTAPEYINLEPSTDIAEAQSLVETVVKNARRLNQLADQLLDAFTDSGVTNDLPVEDDAAEENVPLPPRPAKKPSK